MAARHRMHKKAGGGRLVYAGSGSNVNHEANEEHELDHKRGGRAKHHLGHTHGHKSKPRLDKRARGGGIKHGGQGRKAEGHRATGVGADRSPFSSAAHSGDYDRRSDGLGGKGPNPPLEHGEGNAGKTKRMGPGHEGGTHPRDDHGKAITGYKRGGHVPHGEHGSHEHHHMHHHVTYHPHHPGHHHHGGKVRKHEK